MGRWTRRGLIASGVGIALGGGYVAGNGGLDEHGLNRSTLSGLSDSYLPRDIESFEFDEYGSITITLAPDHESELWGIWHEHRSGWNYVLFDGESPQFQGPIRFAFLYHLHQLGAVYPSARFELRLFARDRDRSFEERMTSSEPAVDRTARRSFTVPEHLRDSRIFEDGEARVPFNRAVES